MGVEVIHTAEAKPQGLVSTYTIMAYPGHELPQCYTGVLYSKWLRSLRNGNDYYKLCDPAGYYEAYTRHIGHLLSMPHTVVRVAVLTDDKDVVLGFSVSRGHILDYVYVHKDQRRHYIGTNLVPRDIQTITHLTRTGLAIWSSKYGHLKFNPFG